MPVRRELETGRFDAKADDETVFTVVEVTTFIQMVTFSGPAGWVPEGKALRLTSGSAVEPVEHGCYRIADTDRIIRKLG